MYHSNVHSLEVEGVVTSTSFSSWCNYGFVEKMKIVEEFMLMHTLLDINF